MKTALTSRLVNHPFGDPGLFVSLRWQGRALQFDLGRIGRMDAGELLKLTHVFVSHAHMDHFMGFDHLLRLFLHRDAKLHLYGPAEFLQRLAARLAGYTWNLTEEYPLEIIGHEIRADRVFSATFRAAGFFSLEEYRETPFDGVLLDEPALAVRTAVLDHKIPCLAFAVSEKSHLNIDAAALERLRLRPGRWIDRMKQAIRDEQSEDLPIVADAQENGGIVERRLPLGELRRELVIESRGQKIGYVVDTLFNDDNRRKIVELVDGADIFFCEAPFLDEDVEQATKRYHLTARQAGILAREAGVRRLEVFHFPPRYEGRAEAKAAFRGEP